MSSSGWGIVNGLEQLAEVEQPDFLKPDRINLELFTDNSPAKAGALASRRWMLDDTPTETW